MMRKRQHSLTSALNVASSRRPPKVTIGARRAKYIVMKVAKHWILNASVKSDL